MTIWTHNHMGPLTWSPCIYSCLFPNHFPETLSGLSFLGWGVDLFSELKSDHITLSLKPLLPLPRRSRAGLCMMANALMAPAVPSLHPQPLPHCLLPQGLCPEALPRGPSSRSSWGRCLPPTHSQLPPWRPLSTAPPEGLLCPRQGVFPAWRTHLARRQSSRVYRPPEHKFGDSLWSVHTKPRTRTRVCIYIHTCLKYEERHTIFERMCDRVCREHILIL